MSTTYQILDVIPHDRPMSLLDSIESYHIEGLEASVTVTSDSLFAGEEGVPSWVGIEYMGQAIAAFSGVWARERNEPVKIGFLVGARRYEPNCSYFPLGATLKVSVDEIANSSMGLRVFECKISGDGIAAKANLNVYMPDNIEEFLQGER